MKENLFHNNWEQETSLAERAIAFHSPLHPFQDYEQLWEKVITEADGNAFESIFNHYYNTLCTFALRYLKSKEEARDNVSEVFYRIWKNKERLKISTSLRAYLFISVKNQCYNHLSRSLKKNESLSIDNTDFLNESMNPHEAFAFNELEQDINSAIEALSPQCKHVFLLSRADGLKYNEISTKLNISEKAVEANISRALKFLRKKLQKFVLITPVILLSIFS